VAWSKPRVDLCYGCLPGGPFTPPACTHCGARRNYYSAGLCQDCHPSSAKRTESCRDCLAWGVPVRGKHLCWGCHGWRDRYPMGRCISCGRAQAVDEHQACRLCRRQAILLRSPRQALDIVGANRNGQQLYIANMWFSEPGVRKDQHQPPRPPAVIPARPLLAEHRQQVLFEQRRDLTDGRVHHVAEPGDPAMAAYLDHCVRDHAARHGWSSSPLNRARLAARVLAATQDTPGAAIRAMDVMALSTAQLPVRPMLTILAEIGMLDDDRAPALDSWFIPQIAELPEQMRAEITAWYEALTFGSTTPPRIKPKKPVTIRLRVMWAKPALHAWVAAGIQSLREITASDIRDVLPDSGTPRATMGEALHSIFKVLKAKKIIFTDPARAIRIGRVENRDPQPANMTILRAAIHSDDPERSAPAALLAFCGLWSRELRELRLNDIYDQRIHVNGRTIPLADPVRERLNTYLDYRNQRWPNTANPHVFLNQQSATHTRPVDRTWLNRRLGTSAHALREDRILHEAQAGADPRQLADLFGLTIGGALRYTSAAERLNADPHTINSGS